MNGYNKDNAKLKLGSSMNSDQLPDMGASVNEQLHQSAAQHPVLPALSALGSDISYSDLLTLSAAASNTLHSTAQITLTTDDGYRLSATRYGAIGAVKGNILVAGATGVQQRFYRRFAEHAALQGYSVLTLDYRGVGQSSPKSLKGFEMSYLDWGFCDLAAAVDFMSDEGIPLFWVGHSFGGHGLGLLPNHHKITAAYCFGTGAGWAGWMPKLERLKVRLLWSCILPLIVWRKGYMAWSILGMGDDLPLGVYKDWKRWCAHPHYFFDDPSMSAVADCYASVRTPIVFANATDDLWAPPRSRDAFIKGYSNAPVITRDIYATEAIGHMGYFRLSALNTWDEMLKWFALQHAQLPTFS